MTLARDMLLSFSSLDSGALARDHIANLKTGISMGDINMVTGNSPDLIFSVVVSPISGIYSMPAPTGPAIDVVVPVPAGGITPV